LTGHGYRVTGTPTADLATGRAGCVIGTVAGGAASA
jgi:hypothetical protein